MAAELRRTPRIGSLGSRNLVALGVILGLAMLIGTFLDYEISADLLHEGSLFGVIMAAFGWYPAIWALAASGALLLVLAARGYGRAGPMLGVAGVVLISGAVGVGVVLPPSYWVKSTGETLSFGISVAASLTSTTLIVALSVFFARQAEARAVLRVAVLLLVVVAAQAAVIYLIKILWLRPRMRLVAQDVGVPYEPWWHAGFPDLQQWLAWGIPKDDFKSFPSAHTGNAATALLLTQVLALDERGRKLVTPVFWLAVLFALAVALSRIVVGAHFVTDTVVGTAVVVACLALARNWLAPTEGDVAPHR